MLLPPPISVIREIVDPELVRIPRRKDEGCRPIFDREELREGIIRRMKSGNTDDNPDSNAGATETQQRVVAIIREPLIHESYAAHISSSSSLLNAHHDLNMNPSRGMVDSRVSDHHHEPRMRPQTPPRIPSHHHQFENKDNFRRPDESSSMMKKENTVANSPRRGEGLPRARYYRDSRSRERERRPPSGERSRSRSRSPVFR